MFQRDYFMRMIEQMTEAVGQVMQLRRELKQADALIVIDELLDRRFGLSGKLIRTLSDEDLLAVMTKNGVVETDNIQAIAILFKQEAELYEDLGKEAESFAHSLKALHLFMRLSLIDAPPTLANSSDEAAILLGKLSPYELSSRTKRLVAEWHESEGAFALAENIWYELLEDGAADKGEVAAFYMRLLPFQEDKLAAGGLPIEEIRTGLNSLEMEQ
ncbi:DUF6483 family protein [Paenibacillus sp. FSL H8-0537]|uniref:DUF6483 family protein n=1 Tax=Paenibacillus sp. FSL H8-0537 TaxID=2921399 RepID=UPI003100F8AF